MTLKDLLGEEWFEILKDEFSKDYMSRLCGFINHHRDVGTVFPPKEDVFNAYKFTPYSKVKVCIIGMDPYINENEAMGLSFSTKSGKYTPSLRQMEKAIRRDIYPDNDEYEWSNDLTRWTKQGIMLLNAVLTVNKGASGSHKGKGWETFTLKTIQELDKKGVIFLLWGKDAQALKYSIKNSTIIEAEHPVAASYQGRLWNNNKCFTKVNELLDTKINW